MNKAELVEQLALKTRMPKNQAEAVLDATLEIIQGTVAEGKDVKLVGFGTFSQLARSARKGRNPKTGESVEIPGGQVPRFRPGKEFRSRLG